MTPQDALRLEKLFDEGRLVVIKRLTTGEEEIVSEIFSPVDRPCGRCTRTDLDRGENMVAVTYSGEASSLRTVHGNSIRVYDRASADEWQWNLED